ncbi:MAG: ABC transporter ATP-binding protein/permease [Oscillospiraceae bacterium]|nr:ABC transporter ATP-binding protein/permease [Oscillospiraceae bacterium]
MQDETLAQATVACETEIIKKARADMNVDGVYQDYELILTHETLTVVTYEIQEQTRIFAGFPGTKLLPPPPKVVQSVDEYAVSDISEPVIGDLVSGGVISVEINGQAKALCATTNLYKAECAKLIAVLEKLCKSEDLPEEEKEDERVCPRCGTVYPEEGRAVCMHCINRGTLFIRTLRYFMPYKKQFIPLFICILGVAALSIVWPYLSGQVLYDQVLRGGGLPWIDISSPYTQLLILALSMVAVRVVQQLFGIIQGRIIAKIVPYVVRSIKEKTFAALEKLSISFFAKRQTGALMTRVLEDAEQVAGFFIDGLPFLFVNTMTILASIGIMLAINWKMAIATIVAMPLMLLIHLWLGPAFWNMVGRRHRARRRMVSQVNDNITGARVVKAFGQQSKEMGRFDRTNRRVRDSEMSLVKVDSLYTALYFACHTLIQLTVWIVGSILVLNNEPGFSFGTLITFINYTALLIGPIEFFSFVVRWWANSMNSSSRIFEIIDHQPDVVEPLDPTPLPHMAGAIKLKNVTFGYDAHKNVLKDISLDIPAGHMLGVVGKSGAGKSTLVNLISRLYDVTDGEISIDGINIKQLSFADLRRQVAMVSQETYIFMGTIAENIAYGCPDVSRDDIVKAAMAASAHDFISKCPDGYDTLVGAGYRDLSGGERQRVSIARAILTNPRILILDEATAAMDTETEGKIQAALDELIVGRTTISIAHRLSTLRNADSLIVVEDGKIVEQGTHMELIKQKGAYFTLVQLQGKALAMRGIGGGAPE